MSFDFFSNFECWSSFLLFPVSYCSQLIYLEFSMGWIKLVFKFIWFVCASGHLHCKLNMSKMNSCTNFYSSCFIYNMAHSTLRRLTLRIFSMLNLPRISRQSASFPTPPPLTWTSTWIWLECDNGWLSWLAGWLDEIPPPKIYKTKYTKTGFALIEIHFNWP